MLGSYNQLQNIRSREWHRKTFVLMLTIILGKGSSQDLPPISCEANVTDGIPIITCNYPPDIVHYDIFLMHTEGIGHTEEPEPVYSCTSKKGSECTGIDGFELCSKPNDTNIVAIQIPTAYLVGYLFCTVHDNKRPNCYCNFTATSDVQQNKRCTKDLTKNSTISTPITTVLLQNLKSFVDESGRHHNVLVGLLVAILLVVVILLLVNYSKFKKIFNKCTWARQGTPVGNNDGESDE